MEQIFENIFLKKGWLAEDTVSGLGSTIRATNNLRQALTEMGEISICDIPCGDMNWMKEIYNGFRQYYGIDIVKPIIAQNTLKYSNNKAKFIHGDICSFDFSSINADLILVRDCLVHLSLEDIISALSNICKSNIPNIAITHFTGNRPFIDIKTGQWRPINFCIHPFNFNEPLRIINEGCLEGNGTFADKSIGIWDRLQIIKSLQNMQK